jgi:hypothetical protein
MKPSTKTLQMDILKKAWKRDVGCARTAKTTQRPIAYFHNLFNKSVWPLPSMSLSIPGGTFYGVVE